MPFPRLSDIQVPPETLAIIGREPRISADSHMKEPPDLWETRLPAALRDRAPRFAHRDDASSGCGRAVGTRMSGSRTKRTTASAPRCSPHAGATAWVVGDVELEEACCRVYQDDDVAAFEGVAAELTIEIIETLDAASHEGAQQDARVVIERVAQHGGDGEDGVAIDDALLEHLADLAHPVIDVDLGAAQAQGGLTAHGDEVFTLPTIEASVVNVSDLFRIATREHLVDQLIIVSCIITRVEFLKFIPMIMEYLFKDIPSGSEFSIHSA